MLYVNSANFVRYLANPIANFLVKHGELKTNTYIFSSYYFNTVII